jgi:hypothetical protein
MTFRVFWVFIPRQCSRALQVWYLASRQLRKQRQKTVPNAAAYANPTSEWRTELHATPLEAHRLGQIGAGTPKYEIDGRQVGGLR